MDTKKKTKKSKTTTRRASSTSDLSAGFVLARADGSMSFVVQKGTDDFLAYTGGGVAILDGPTDRFGVPEHQHSAIKLGALAPFATHLADGATVVAVEPVFTRSFAGANLLLYAHEGRWIVIGLSDLTKEQKKSVRNKRDAGAASLEVPEHQHWLPYTTPAPFDAAWRIFAAITADEVKAGLAACNCGPRSAQESYADAMQRHGLDPSAGVVLSQDPAWDEKTGRYRDARGRTWEEA
jgi:hypothetical protein